VACYRDADNDSFGDKNAASRQCNSCPPGRVANETDCSDAEYAVRPSGTEVPGDGIDQTCNGRELCFVDADKDGARTNAVSESTNLACAQAEGRALASALADCDDASPAVKPLAPEITADGIDQDCDGWELCYADVDRDGARLTTTVKSKSFLCETSHGAAIPTAPVDCNDENPLVRPREAEVVGDGTDQDCDGKELCFVDADKDGARALLFVESPNTTCATEAGLALTTAKPDCNDQNPLVKPEVAEAPGDGVDQLCDGKELCFVDADKDGSRSVDVVESAFLACPTAEGLAPEAAAIDCKESDPAIHAGALEILGDGVDQNCDAKELCYRDTDQDGFRANETFDTESFECAKASGAALSSVGLDCDDTQAQVFPGATSPEVAGDNTDQNCDGKELCFVDADKDGARTTETAASNTALCESADGLTLASASLDCSDADALTKPASTRCSSTNGVETCGADGNFGAAVPCVDQACVAGACTGLCAPADTQCSGDGVKTCSLNGEWQTPVACVAPTPKCREGACIGLPSCIGIASSCGAGENCCISHDVSGGGYNRSNDPASAARVSDFRLDKYEVTVARFRKFLAGYTAWRKGGHPLAGEGKHPLIGDTGWMAAWPLASTAADLTGAIGSCGAGGYRTWTDAPDANENLPMSCVTWYEAFAFCAWDEGRLPTETEWDFAAVGGDEQRAYPWGNTHPGNNANLAVYDCRYNAASSQCDVSRVAPVGSIAAGAARFGQLDLAGNMWEWAFDAHAAAYANPCVDCANTASSSTRVIRGGTFDWSTFGRNFKTAADRGFSVGFRCAR